jgi:hypothetical protein
MVIKYTNVYRSKALQNLPKFGTFGLQANHLATRRHANPFRCPGPSCQSWYSNPGHSPRRKRADTLLPPNWCCSTGSLCTCSWAASSSARLVMSGFCSYQTTKPLSDFLNTRLPPLVCHLVTDLSQRHTVHVLNIGVIVLSKFWPDTVWLAHIICRCLRNLVLPIFWPLNGLRIWCLVA